MKQGSRYQINPGNIARDKSLKYQGAKSGKSDSVSVFNSVLCKKSYAEIGARQRKLLSKAPKNIELLKMKILAD